MTQITKDLPAGRQGGGEYMNKKLLVTVAAVSILSGGLVMASTASAESSSNQDHMSSLVQKIADKFNLDTNDVQEVFDQERKEMHAKMQAKYEARLTQLVKNGKITEQQKQLLLDKHKELQSEMESNKDKFKDLTPAERKSQMDAKRKELEAWAKENGVDIKYLMPMLFHMKVGGGPGFMKHGSGDQNVEFHHEISDEPTATVTASPTQ